MATPQRGGADPLSRLSRLARIRSARRHPQENWRWCSGKGKLEIRNIGSEPRTVVLQMAFEGNGRGAAQLCVHGASFCQTFQLNAGRPCSLRQAFTTLWDNASLGQEMA